jgi:hypothetical protein
MSKLISVLEKVEVLHEHAVPGNKPRCMDPKFYLGKEMLAWMVRCAAMSSSN